MNTLSRRPSFAIENLPEHLHLKGFNWLGVCRHGLSYWKSDTVSKITLILVYCPRFFWIGITCSQCGLPCVSGGHVAEHPHQAISGHPHCRHGNDVPGQEGLPQAPAPGPAAHHCHHRHHFRLRHHSVSAPFLFCVLLPSNLCLLFCILLALNSLPFLFCILLALKSLPSKVVSFHPFTEGLSKRLPRSAYAVFLGLPVRNYGHAIQLQPSSKGSKAALLAVSLLLRDVWAGARCDSVAHEQPQGPFLWLQPKLQPGETQALRSTEPLPASKWPGTCISSAINVS